MAEPTTYKIKTYNKISGIGLAKFKSNYEVSADLDNPEAIVLRSFNLHDELVSESVLAVGRAGAGVNNIPVEELGKKGIVVFNTPGANANSVKELVLAGMLIASRNLVEALDYTAELSSENMKDNVEAGKKKFVGNELAGRYLQSSG